MKPARGLKKFRQETRYPHLRSDGLTDRHNGGTRATTREKPKVDGFTEYYPDDAAVWYPDTVEPPQDTYVLVQTVSGIRCVAWKRGIFWTCDGFRVLDSEDFVEYWTHIRY